jgi:hypothetical protein
VTRAAAPVGSIVNITYDPDPGVKVIRGDVLRTQSGRLYRVFWVFKAKRTKYPGRLTLQVQVIDTMPVDDRKPFPVTDDLHDAPDGAVIELEDGKWERRLDTWHPVGTMQVHELHWHPRKAKAK